MFSHSGTIAGRDRRTDGHILWQRMMWYAQTASRGQKTSSHPGILTRLLVRISDAVTADVINSNGEIWEPDAELLCGRWSHPELVLCTRIAYQQFTSPHRLMMQCSSKNTTCRPPDSWIPRHVFWGKSSTAVFDMHHLTCAVSFLLHSSNLILLTLAPPGSPRHSPCLHSNHLSFP